MSTPNPMTQSADSGGYSLYDLLHLRTQRNLAMVLIIGYFGTVWSLIYFWKEMSSGQIGLLSGLLGVLTAILPLSLQSFFPKHNPESTAGPTGPAAPAQH